MRVRSLLNLFLVLASVLGVARAHAGVRAEAANRKYICPTNPGEIWLWFDLNGGRVFRQWGDAQFITLKWEGDRVPIWGKEDQDGPFYFERSGNGYAYGGHACREVAKLPIERLKKKDFVE